MIKKLLAKNQPKNDKFAVSFILGLFAAFNFGFFIPLDFYISNIYELLLPLKSVLWITATVSVIIFLTVFLICLLTKDKLHKFCCSAVFGISFALYLESNFLSLDLGTLNGEQYKVSPLKSVIDIAVWVIILVIPFIIYKKSEKVHINVLSYLPAAIFLIELITLCISLMNVVLFDVASTLDRAVIWSDTRDIPSTKDLYTYSENKNLLIILTDEYDSFCFDNSLKTDPDSVSEFDGFTYYTNTIGLYGSSDPSIKYMTTGNKEGVPDPYKDDKFFQNIKKRYKTDLYGPINLFNREIFSKYADNYKTEKIKLGNYVSIAEKIYMITCYKSLPKVFKGFFWSDSDNINSFFGDSDSMMVYYPDNLSFYYNLTETPDITNEDCFKFIYLYGLHDPRNIDKNLERQDNWKVGGDEQAVAVNKILNKYFEILKKNGVYDNSEILLLADHGIKSHEVGRYPLLMYKPANQDFTGIRTSTAPISHEDLYPTFLKLSGEDPDADTIWDIPEGILRTRRFEQTNEDITVENIKDGKTWHSDN